MKHNLSLDTFPESYPLNPRVEKVKFYYKHLTLVGWIKAQAFNTISDFKDSFDERDHRMTAGTIVRKFLNRPTTIKTTTD